MALIGFKRGQTSVVLRAKILNSTVTTGAGKTGLAYNTTGLIISTIADTEATPTVYTTAATNIETITTLGTYATPTTGRCRFREVDPTNHPGIYELQVANPRFAVASAKSLIISICGVSGAAELDMLIPLCDIDPYDPVRFGMMALPNAAAEAAGGLFTRGTNAGQINQTVNGRIDSNPVSFGGVTVTGRDIGASVLLSSGTGAGQIILNSGVVVAGKMMT